MDYAFNELMWSTWQAVQDRLDACPPGPELRRIIRAGLSRESGRIYVGLQSAPGKADPDIDFPVGSVHLYQLGDPGDDARTQIESYTQPVLVVTCQTLTSAGCELDHFVGRIREPGSRFRAEHQGGRSGRLTSPLELAEEFGFGDIRPQPPGRTRTAELGPPP